MIPLNFGSRPTGPEKLIVRIEMTLNSVSFEQLRSNTSMVSWSRELPFAGYERMRTTFYTFDASELSYDGHTLVLI